MDTFSENTELKRRKAKISGSGLQAEKAMKHESDSVTNRS